MFQGLGVFSVSEFVLRLGTKHSLLKDSDPWCCRTPFVLSKLCMGSRNAELWVSTSSCCLFVTTSSDPWGQFGTFHQHLFKGGSCFCMYRGRTSEPNQWPSGVMLFSHHPLQKRLKRLTDTKPWPVRSQNCRLMVKKHSPRQSLHLSWEQEYSHWSSSSTGPMCIISLVFEE